MSYYNSGHLFTRYNQSLSFQRYSKYLVTNDETHQGVFLIKTGTQSDGRGRYTALCGDGTPIGNNLNDWITAHSHLKYSINDGIVPNEPDYPTTTSYNANSLAINGTRLMQKGNGTDSPNDYMIECNIPIFDVTDGDYTGANKYITTGDDSDADNYEDLHPTGLNITVKIDGTSYPNFYISSEYTGENPVEYTYYCTGSNLGLLSNKTSSGNLNSDSMYYFTYGELFADKKLGRCIFECPALLTNPGELIPDNMVDFYWDGSDFSIGINPSHNGKVTLNVEFGVPSDEDYPDDDNPWQNTDSTNTYTGANMLTDTYNLTPAKLISLGNFLWSSTFKDNIFSLCNYPLENIIAIKAMPIVISGTDKEIKIGNVNTGITSAEITEGDNYETTIGEIFIPEYFKNFIDYSAVNLQIYLPFIGYKEIDNLVCMNRWLRIKYVWDVIMGTCMAVLEVKDINGEYMQYQCFQGNCGTDIAITSTNRASIENGYINAGLDTVSDILRGDFGGAVKDVFNASTQDFHSQSNGAGNPSLMNRLKNSCYVIVRRPKKFEIAKNYGHIFGFPLYKKMELSSQRGFTVCENFDCHIAKATEGERSEIKALMESGVYIKEVL